MSTTVPALAWDLRRRATQLWLLAPGAVAAAVAFGVVAAGLHGPDVAAQLYRTVEVRLHGFTLFDVGWYGGNYPLGYSVLAPSISAVIGLAPTAVLSAAVAALAFDRLVVGWVGRRPFACWYFAVSLAVEVGIGQFPFLLGLAFGLLAVLAATARRWRVASVLSLLAALSSPVDAAFLALVVVAWTLAEWSSSSPRRRSGLAMVGVVAVVPIGVIGIVFPGTGPFPFTFGNLAGVVGLCLLGLTPAVRAPIAVRYAAGMYAMVAVAVFAVRNPLGNNVMRLGADVGVPLLMCFVDRRRRWVTLTACAGFALWQWAPAVGALQGSGDIPSTQPSFYQPLLRQLAARDAGTPVRIEIPPTLDHWEAAYVAPTVPIARGWERQLDMADNRIFYQPGALTPRSYHRWLLDNGITWVALPNAPLDYAARAEGRLLLAHRVPDLRLVWSSPQWHLWRVTGSPGLVSGPAHLARLGPDRLVVDVAEPARLTVRVRYSTYWSVTRGNGCVSPAAGGWMAVRARARGRLVLSASMLASQQTRC